MCIVRKAESIKYAEESNKVTLEDSSAIGGEKVEKIGRMVQSNPTASDIRLRAWFCSMCVYRKIISGLISEEWYYDRENSDSK